MRRLVRIALKLLLIPPIVAAVVVELVSLPVRRRKRGVCFANQFGRELPANRMQKRRPEHPAVRAPDGILLRGWKLHPARPNGSWVLLFHGIADNRVGMIGHAELLLRGGYGVVMMDMRAHGASEGPIATYGWLERNDTRAIVDVFEADEHPAHLFALGESMGAGIALQSAAVEPRIEAVVAEASFANLTEAAYDYAGLRRFPWLGKTLLAPGAWMMVYRGQRIAGFPASEVSPEKAVAARPFPVLLICDAGDVALPCRHTKMIYAAAAGPKQMWVVPGAYHTAALGYEPAEFRRRVFAFYDSAGRTQPRVHAPQWLLLLRLPSRKI